MARKTSKNNGQSTLGNPANVSVELTFTVLDARLEMIDDSVRSAAYVRGVVDRLPIPMTEVAKRMGVGYQTLRAWRAGKAVPQYSDQLLLRMLMLTMGTPTSIADAIRPRKQRGPRARARR